MSTEEQIVWRMVKPQPQVSGNGALEANLVKQGFRKMIAGVTSDSLQYLVGLAVLGAGNVVLIPLFTRSLTQGEFGTYSLLEVLIVTILTLTTLGLNVAYVKWYSELDVKYRPTLFSTIFLLTATFSTIIGTAFFIAIYSDFGTRWLETTSRRFAWTLVPIVCLETLENIFLAHLRAQRRPLAFCVASAARLVVIVCASLCLLVMQHQGLLGVFLSRLIGDLLGTIVLLCLCDSMLTLRYSHSLARETIGFGLPLVFSAFAASLLDGTGRLFLSHFGSLEQVGLYGVGAKVSGLLRVFLVAPVGVAWGGVMFEIARNENARAIYSKLMSYMLLLGVFAVAVVDLFAPLVLAVFAPPAYMSARSVISILLLTQVAAMLQYPCSIGIYLKGSTKVFLPLYLVTLSLSAGLNLVLIPQYGLYGAAYAWLASSVVLVVSMGVVSHRLYPLPYDFKPGWLAVSIWIAGFLLRSLNLNAYSVANIAISSGFAVLGALTVFWFLRKDFHDTALKVEGAATWQS
jgi:O-antigen/teichoic acid export membrane protein